jgi:hypothetical protein
MNYWFAVSNDIVDDPKFKLISRQTCIAKPYVIIAWIYILREASRGETRGIIGRLNADEAECVNDISAVDFVKIVKAFADKGLITYDEIVETPNGTEFYNINPAYSAYFSITLNSPSGRNSLEMIYGGKEIEIINKGTEKKYQNKI